MPFINLETCHLRYKGLIFTSREILFNSERQSLTPFCVAIVLKSAFYHRSVTLLPPLIYMTEQIVQNIMCYCALLEPIYMDYF